MESGPVEYWGVILNYYLNHSKIKPYTIPDGIDYLDAGKFITPGSRLFRYPDGVIFFWPETDGFFMEAHFLKTKGKAAKKRIELAIKRVGGPIIAEAPQFNKASRYMMNALGFKRVGVSGQWVKDGVTYDVIRYRREHD
jgi:hypothetical protein